MAETLPAKYRPLAATGKSPEQRRFVEAYCGDVKATCERTGLAPSDCRSWEKAEWFQDALNKRYDHETMEIRRQNIYQLGKEIVGRQEIQAMWSDIATNTKETVQNRLKASELLAKSHGMMVEKVVHEGNAAKPIMVAKLDLDDRIKLLLGAPIEATIVPDAKPSQPLETPDDDWLDAPKPVCADADAIPGSVQANTGGQ